MGMGWRVKKENTEARLLVRMRSASDAYESMLSNNPSGGFEHDILKQNLPADWHTDLATFSDINDKTLRQTR